MQGRMTHHFLGVRPRGSRSDELTAYLETAWHA